MKIYSLKQHLSFFFLGIFLTLGVGTTFAEKTNITNHSESKELVSSEIIANMQKVADWQMENFTYNANNSHDHGITS